MPNNDELLKKRVPLRKKAQLANVYDSIKGQRERIFNKLDPQKENAKKIAGPTGQKKNFINGDNGGVEESKPRNRNEAAIKTNKEINNKSKELQDVSNRAPSRNIVVNTNYYFDGEEGGTAAGTGENSNTNKNQAGGKNGNSKDDDDIEIKKDSRGKNNNSKLGKIDEGSDEDEKDKKKKKDKKKGDSDSDSDGSDRSRGRRSRRSSKRRSRRKSKYSSCSCSECRSDYSSRGRSRHKRSSSRKNRKHRRSSSRRRHRKSHHHHHRRSCDCRKHSRRRSHSRHGRYYSKSSSRSHSRRRYSKYDEPPWYNPYGLDYTKFKPKTQWNLNYDALNLYNSRNDFDSKTGALKSIDKSMNLFRHKM